MKRTTRRRFSGLAGSCLVLLLGGCTGRATGMHDGECDTDTPGAGEACELATETGPPGGTTSGDPAQTDDPPGGDTGEVPIPEPDVDGNIDCADLPAPGQTVGGGDPSPLGFPSVGCSPRQSGEGAYRCCSDDPAAEGGGRPAYMGKNIVDGRTPLFSGINNGLGTAGLCVATDELPAGSGLLEPAAQNCPMPCNPTWDDTEVEAVCGPSRRCCQTRELQPEDCVFDGELWRPVTGEDIGNTAISPATNWAPGQHGTHQDPGGAGCLSFSGGQMNEVFRDCVQQLSVADQRGFCMSLGAGQACPGEDPSYLDACEQINMGLIPPPE